MPRVEVEEVVAEEEVADLAGGVALGDKLENKIELFLSRLFINWT